MGGGGEKKGMVVANYNPRLLGRDGSSTQPFLNQAQGACHQTEGRHGSGEGGRYVESSGFGNLSLFALHEF